MKLNHFPAVIALAVAASGAFAHDQSIVIAQTSPGLFSGSFSDTHLQSGLFVDTFTFSLLGASSSALGSGALTFSSSSGAISLVVATLDGANGASVASPPDPSMIAIPSMLSFTAFSAPLTLTVLGSAGDPFADPVALDASYRGTITFSTSVSAIPEPTTYGLMLAGLVGIVIVARRRACKKLSSVEFRVDRPA